MVYVCFWSEQRAKAGSGRRMKRVKYRRSAAVRIGFGVNAQITRMLHVLKHVCCVSLKGGERPKRGNFERKPYVWCTWPE